MAGNNKLNFSKNRYITLNRYYRSYPPTRLNHIPKQPNILTHTSQQGQMIHQSYPLSHTDTIVYTLIA